MDGEWTGGFRVTVGQSPFAKGATIAYISRALPGVDPDEGTTVYEVDDYLGLVNLVTRTEDVACAQEVGLVTPDGRYMRFTGPERVPPEAMLRKALSDAGPGPAVKHTVRIRQDRSSPRGRVVSGTPAGVRIVRALRRLHPETDLGDIADLLEELCA